MKIPYRLTVCAALAFSSLLHAGATIDVIPTEPGPYQPGQSLTMDVFLTQDPGGTHRGLRLVQFDFSDTDPALQSDLQFSFDFSSVATGAANYVVFETPPPQHMPIPAFAFLGLDYPNGNPFDPLAGVGWSSGMVVLSPDAPLHIGSFGMTLPSQPGEYLLDLMNADIPDPRNEGAVISFGFGGRGDEQIFWVPGDLDQIAGGVFSSSDTAGAGFTFGFDPISGRIVPEPATLFLVGLGALGLIRRRSVLR